MAVFVIRALCLLLIVFIYHKNCLGLAVVSEEIATQQHPSKDFNRHTLIKPRIYHGREKRQLATTKIKDGGGHIHHLTVTYELDGQNYTVDLNLNRDLLPEGYFHRYQKDGGEVVDKPSSDEVELCHYHGKIRDEPDSWAALSTCDDSLKGVIFDGEEMHYIEKNSVDDEHHYVYKHSDVEETGKRCGYDEDHVEGINEILRYKRDIEPIIRGPYNSNKQSRYVELVLVVDNMLYREFNSSLDKVERYCKDVTNIINGLFSQLNVFIALVGVVTWSESNPIEISSNGNMALTNFLRYRRENLIKQHPNDHAQLLSKVIFDNNVVNKALVGPICTYQFSGSITTYHSPIVGVVASTVAHTLGHNFGMQHDTSNCSCPGDSCIMSPSVSAIIPKHWSNCSVEYLELAFQHGMDQCLRNKPKSLFGSSVCGNGFVEPGEECDCGSPEDCANICCDPRTCLLKANATCATGECCNLQTCQIKNAGTVCRYSDRECDLPEYCQGDSEYCPTDVYKANGELCGEGKAYCYDGSCRTRSDQCRVLWGTTGKASDELCYKMNSKGNRHGNCGYDKVTQTYKKCDDNDMLCGLLHCKHQNDRLEFGMESVAVLSHSFLNLKGSIIPCRTAIVDLGLSVVDPGLVPDGAKCGDGRMCVNQTCLPVETVRTRCPNDCSGNGVCNSLGNCHCNVGFAPPTCQHPVEGGPVSDSSSRTADPKGNNHPTKDFKRHVLIQPKIYHSRNKREITTTKNEDNSSHLDHVTLTYDLDGQNYIIDLNLNRDLLPEGYFHRYQKNGSHIVDRPSAEEVELCHYKGKIRDKPDSWAALSTCEDYVKGVIFDGNEMYYIEKNSAEDDHHYLYRHSDIAETGKRCGYEDGADHNHDTDEDDKYPGLNRILRYKRDIEPIIRGPYKANKQSRYVELVLVVDNIFYKELDSSRSNVERYCKDITNIINGIYSSLNIFIALVGVVTWTERNEIEFSDNGDTTLTNFLHYRRENLIRSHPNDNAQLITKFSFNNGVVGKALKGPICTYQFSGGVNNNHSPVIGLVATTIAHEMGHNFGMEHDTNECACPEDRCIMAPSSSSVAPKHWSNCSVEYLALAFEHGMDYCLRNKPKSLFGTSVCGNGFVEPGEQCDCGLPEHCDNTCCNATTCLLNANASCATGECCDLNTCKPRRAGTMCRSADIECDLPEYCTGHSEYCPPDVYKLDAEPCNGGKAYCYHGYCRTRSDQCKLLWGNTGKASDEQCYKMNSKGNRHGNCGYDKFSQIYKKCYDENVLCGMLHCKHLNERLEFGMESVAILSHSFLNLKGSIIPCRTAIVDLGLNQVDPGLAPDGAKCGNNSMCVNQTCLSVESLRAVGPRCPNNCNGNGVCNSLGHCHCKDGFGSPTCEYPGPGGSQDSGPASDPNARKEFVTAVFIIFLGIIPALALISLLLYYARQNLKLTWSQSSSTYVTCCFSCLSRISQRTFTACKGMGNTKKTKTQATLPTVSENVEKQQNFERLQQESEETGRRKSSNMDIMFSKLVFTTNKQGINNSVSVKNPQATQGETPNTSSGSQKITVIEEPPKRRMSFKNIKGLKVNTNVKLGKKSVSNEGSTAEPLIDEASTVSVKNLAKQFDFQNKRKNNVNT